ncbi:hypothetical protein VE26_06005 [Devosia chinhatensis]|uniref:Uncharacterized protein n=2 Tax=Devosia chinhatensis TaxID=429727 RepID=A0A0F5FMM7_9HYPH|nr:hypothetical protein VE26_06005 [Devosia chinhatensis]
MFIEGRHDCEKQIQSAVSLSEQAIGQLSNWQGIWGSILHARVIMNSGSMIKVIEAATDSGSGAQLLDHFSVASIARTAVEAGVMMLYVSDPNLSEAEFDMRRKVFQLHDTCHRSRMFKHHEAHAPDVKEMRDLYRQKIAELRTELDSMPAFAALATEVRSRLLEGRDFYVGGVRGALKLIGWDKAEYDFYEAYFSGYVHSMPMSFLRAEMHGIDFATISEFQYDLCGFALNAVAETLERTTARMTQLLEARTSQHGQT